MTNPVETARQLNDLVRPQLIGRQRCRLCSTWQDFDADLGLLYTNWYVTITQDGTVTVKGIAVFECKDKETCKKRQVSRGRRSSVP